MQSVTIRDVAVASRVSVTTVSRALNDQPDISEVTKSRVKKVAADLGYLPNQSARSLRQFRSNAIAVIVKGPNNPFFSELLNDVEARLRHEEYVVNLIRVAHDEDEVEAALHAVATTKVRGLLLLGGWFTAEQDKVARINVPKVLVTMPVMANVDPTMYSSVAVDDRAGIACIVDHLVSQGHTKVGFIGPEVEDSSIGYIRLQQFIEEMSRHGLEVDPGLIIRGTNLDSPYSFEYGYLVTSAFLERTRDFTALVGMTDAVALGGLRALADHGISVPGDVALTGFDGIEHTEYSTPRLTTISQPMAQLAEAACVQLMTQMAGDSIRHIVLPGTLVARESTGA